MTIHCISNRFSGPLVSARGRVEHKKRGATRYLTVGSVLLCMLVACPARSATEPDRLYRMGEDDVSPSGAVSDTFDSIFLDGSTFVDAQDLTAGGTSPTYTTIGGSIESLPGGVNSTNAISFDGSDDFLTGAAFGRPSLTVSNTDSQSPILGNYDGLSGRGFQFWARPADNGGGSPATGSDQTLISDAERHAVVIDAAGQWRARYNNTFRTSGIAASADSWTHLMLVSPNGTTGATFYVNGLAAVGFSGGYTNTGSDLFIGARSDTAEFYSGIIDEVDMFVLGDNGTVSATFDYTTDNEYFTEVFLPSQSGYGVNDPWVIGDTDFDGDVDTNDVNSFIANWLTSNIVTGGVQAGDYTSIMIGDFDADGDVDRQDFFLLRQANPSAALAAAHAIATPEPAAVWMLVGVFGLLALANRRRILARRLTPEVVRVGALTCLAFGLASPSFAQITWDAGGDGVSVFQEENWTANGDIAGTDPPADTVNPNTAVDFDMIVENVSGMGATAGGDNGAGTLVLGDGFSLTVRENATYRANIGNGSSIQGTSGGLAETLTIQDSASVFAQFVSDIDVAMSDASSLLLNGSGDPIGGTSTIDLAAAWTGTVNFAGESPSNVFNEHLPSITVNGSPAAYGTNVNLMPDGSGGTILTVGTSQSLATLTVDRNTGNMLLENNTGSSLGTIIQYDVQSASGGFELANWDSIADTGGLEGDGTPIGATDWFELTASGTVSSDLSEGTFGAGIDFVDGLSLDLGDASWIPSPFDDIRIVLQDDQGNDIEVIVVYTGTPILEGDFTGDGVIDELDWPTVRDNLLTDVSSMAKINQYLSGDLTGDGIVNRLDFNEFKALFEAQPGAGSFEAMLSSIATPEPGSLCLVALMVVGLVLRHQRPLRWIASLDRTVLSRRKTCEGQIRMSSGDARRLALLTFAVFAPVAAHAQIITWDAGGDGVSTYQEANWVVTDDTGSAALAGLVGMDPPAGFVDGAVDVEANAIVGGVGTAGGPAGAGGHFDLGSGFSLTVQDDATFRVRINDSGNNRGIRGVSGGLDESLFIQDNAEVTTQFINNLVASISGAATLTFGGTGTGTFAGSSTLDLATDWTGDITWLNFAGVSGSNIIGKITVDGAPAIEGDNILVTSDGTQSVLRLNTGLPDPTLLSLVVDPTTGLARIDGADNPIDIDYYEINSIGSQLNTGDWLSLQDQGIDGNTLDDGFGWEEAGGSSAAAVAEAFLAGPGGSNATVSALSPYAFLGALFDGGAAVTDDLSFFYQVNGALIQGNVIADTVIEPVGTDGDYNNDGIVNLADYTVWRDNLGSSATLPNDPTPGSVTVGDYAVWKSNFGQGAAVLSASFAVPEPSTLAVLLGGIFAVCARLATKGSCSSPAR